MHKLFHLSSIVLLTAGLAAQTGRAPTKVGTAIDFPALGPSSSPGSVFANLSPAVNAIQTFEFLPLLDGAGMRVAGKFHSTLTVTRQGSGATEILMGTLDTTVSPWTFTDTTAANLGGIATAGFFHGTMTPDLLVFATDSGSGSLYSVRTSRTQAFPAMKPVGALSGFVDSKLFTWNGSDWYCHQDSFFIALWQFDRTRYATPNDPRTNGFWTFVGSPGPEVNSPEMLLDQTGEGRAIVHCADEGGAGLRARPYFNGLVMQNNVQSSRRFHDGPANATQFVNPSALGGSLIYAVQNTSGAYVDPKMINVVASNGDTVGAAGGTFQLSAWLPYFDRNNPPAVDWAVLILIGVPGPDIAIPGFRGKLALGLTPPFVALPARAWKAETLSADWVVPAPALPSGTTLWTQTLAYDGAGSVNGDTFYFGNTTRLVWQ